jgi:hypothetical protein
MDVRFFDTAGELDAWAREHAEADGEVWVGFPRIRYGHPAPALRYADAAETLGTLGLVQAGRATVDETTYAVRFAPGTVKRPKPPVWAEGPHPEPAFSAEHERRFRDDADAWAFFEAQAPRYRRAAMWWVASGKSEQTRERRFDSLVESSAAGEKVAALQRQM